MASAAAAKMTIDEFLALPEVEGVKREFVDGEIWEENMGTAGQKHEVMKARLNRKLVLAAGDPATFTVMPESGYRFAGGRMMIPDLSLLIGVSPSAAPTELMTFLPEIVIEVVSSDTAERLFQKIATYRKCGVQEVWVIYPHSQGIVQYYSSSMRELGPEDTLSTPLLPGFSYPLSELFS